MGQTKAGAYKFRQTMIDKYGSYENYLQFMRDIAVSGGKASSGYQFAHGKVDPKVASQIAWEKRNK